MSQSSQTSLKHVNVSTQQLPAFILYTPPFAVYVKGAGNANMLTVSLVF